MRLALRTRCRHGQLARAGPQLSHAELGLVQASWWETDVRRCARALHRVLTVRLDGALKPGRRDNLHSAPPCGEAELLAVCRRGNQVRAPRLGHLGAVRGAQRLRPGLNALPLVCTRGCQTQVLSHRRPADRALLHAGDADAQALCWIRLYVENVV